LRVAIVNIGTIFSGDFVEPYVVGDSLLSNDGVITKVGSLSVQDVQSADVVIDADRATAIPGLIDSHVHLTFGDYTPRQKTVGFLESYVHGGVTTSITASEVHVPGRPKDPAGVKALAIAAHKSFKNFRPGGMRVHGGSLILEPGIVKKDIIDLTEEGVWLAKAGFGAFESPFDYVPMIKWAKDSGMITTVHTGGSSIPGSSGIWAEHLLTMQPHVSFHVNGGPVAMPEIGFGRLVNESSIALQVCTAGNLRTTLLVADLLRSSREYNRLLIATDTPTGSGIMPLGMLYTISHLASIGQPPIPVEWAIAAATGNNAKTYRLNSGFLREGCDADIVIIDACAGGSQDNAADALRNGDMVAVAAVITSGIPRFVGRSRNTPASIRTVKVVENRIPQDFSGTEH
jgi:enamidase